MRKKKGEIKFITPRASSWTFVSFSFVCLFIFNHLFGGSETALNFCKRCVVLLEILILRPRLRSRIDFKRGSRNSSAQDLKEKKRPHSNRDI